VQRRYHRGFDYRRAIDIEELRRIAGRRLPAFVREYVEGGSDDERTLARNRDAFSEVRFVHRALVDVAKRSLARTLFGEASALPFAISPTGFNGLLWKHADVALARAARAAGVPFTASTVSSDSIEAIAKEAGRLWFQLYVIRDKSAVDSLIERADHAGCEALLVTVDAPVLGNRSWDSRNYIGKLKLSARAKLDVLLHLRWLLGVFLPSGLPGFGNLDAFLPPNRRSALDGARYMGSQMNSSLGWEDIARIRERWPRRLVLKGLLAASDVQRAIALGCDGVVLSNHGGRQLDGEISALDALPEIVKAVNRRITVMVDGGFRRGTDIAKALALGADVVLLGRATLYGVAAGGEAGASHALQILRDELDRVLALIGCPDINDLGPDYLFGHSASPIRALGHATVA
jgi:(S)-mandelate dehydrogenase